MITISNFSKSNKKSSEKNERCPPLLNVRFSFFPYFSTKLCESGFFLMVLCFFNFFLQYVNGRRWTSFCFLNYQKRTSGKKDTSNFYSPDTVCPPCIFIFNVTSIKNVSVPNVLLKTPNNDSIIA